MRVTVPLVLSKRLTSPVVPALAVSFVAFILSGPAPIEPPAVVSVSVAALSALLGAGGTDCAGTSGRQCCCIR